MFASPAALLVLASILATAGDRRGEIQLDGIPTNLTVAPNGDLWVGSDGYLHVSHDLGRTWATAGHVAGKARVPDETRRDLSNIGFFDDLRGLAVGWDLGRNDKILRTEDGGLTWSPWPAPTEPGVSLLQILPEGHAWIAGPYKLIRTSDWGKTWMLSKWASVEQDFGEAIDFASPSQGIVAGSLNEAAILLTEDGGKTWRKLEVPTRPPGVRIEAIDADWVHVDHIGPVARLGERLVIRVRWSLPYFDHTEAVLVGSISTVPEWRLLDIRGSAIRTFCRHRNGLAALGEDGRVAVLSEGLEPLSVASVADHGSHPALSFQEVASNGTQIVLFDRSAHIGVVEGDTIRVEHFFTPESDPSFPVGDPIWRTPKSGLAVSEHFLYETDAVDRSWQRVGELPRSRLALHRTKGGNAMLGSEMATRASPFYIWRDAEHGFEKQADSDHFYRWGFLQKDDLWLIYGMLAPDEHQADIRTRTSDTTLVGENYTGVVFASADGGDTWTVLDRWPGGRIETLDVGGDGSLAIYRAGGGIRRGKLDLGDPKRPTATMQTVVQPGPPWEERPDWPFVQYGIELRFQDALHGTVQGGMYFSGNRAFATSDGGKTWRRTDSDRR